MKFEPAGQWHPWRPEIVAAAALLLAAPILFLVPINHDAVWQMWVGRQLLHGAGLYTDIVEVNPPLWFWLSVPLAWIAEATGLLGKTVLVAAFLGAITLSFTLAAAVVQPWPVRQRAILYSAFLISVLVLPLSAFGQREHFALIATVPLVLLAARRDHGDRVSWRIALGIGAFAAAGLALKPFFALVPIALELWLWRRTRRIRPETAVLALAAIAYLAALPLLAPAYWSDIVPLARLAYPYFGPSPLGGFATSAVPFILAAPLLVRARGASQAMLIAALAFYVGFLLQGKGWRYQAIPAYGFLLMSASLMPLGRSLMREAAALGAMILMFAQTVGLYRNRLNDELTVHVAAAPGSTVAVLSPYTSPLWPLVEERHYRWPLRYFSLWTLPAISVHAPGTGPLAVQLRRAVIHDLQCNPPHVLVIDTLGFDMKGFFSADPAGASLLSNYELTDEAGHFQILERRRVPRAPPRCRAIH